MDTQHVKIPISATIVSQVITKSWKRNQVYQSVHSFCLNWLHIINTYCLIVIHVNQTKLQSLFYIKFILISWYIYISVPRKQMCYIYNEYNYKMDYLFSYCSHINELTIHLRTLLFSSQWRFRHTMHTRNNCRRDKWTGLHLQNTSRDSAEHSWHIQNAKSPIGKWII